MSENGDINMHINFDKNTPNLYFGMKSFQPKNILSRNELKLLNKYKVQYNYSDIKPMQWKMKRAFDVAASIFSGILVSPMMLVTALAVKADSKGPALFKQERIGRGGNTFVIYKFRTMKNNSESVTNVRNSADNRLTRTGKFLRKYSLDEFPQLFNILKGDMSFVGPRPLRYYDHAIRKQNDDFVIRYVFKPGASLDYKQKNLHFVDDNPEIANLSEKEYIKNWNFRDDIKAFFKIISRMVKGDNC